jgi:capsular polysaccharide biosynthesis protein
MSGDDPTHRGVIPAPVDLAGHFKELGRALLPALVIALLVGGAVFGLRTVLTPKEYAASIVTQIRPAQAPVPGDAFIEQLRAPFMGLAQDTTVLNQVLSEVDTNWDAATLSQHVALSPGPSPELLIFTVTANSPEQAQQLVKSMVVTVAQAAFANQQRDTGARLDQVQASIAAEESANSLRAPDDPSRRISDARLADLRSQLSALQAGGDSLTVLSTPSADPKPVSPQPISEALVAALVALVVAAELIVLFRSRIGATPNRTWARRMAHRYRAGFDPGAGDPGELPALLSADIAHRLREGLDVLMLHGADAVLPRNTALPAGPGEAPRRPVSAALDTTWWWHIDPDDVGLGVVLVTTASRDRKAAEEALRQLNALDLPAWLVLQKPRKGGRRGSTPAQPDPVPEGNGRHANGQPANGKPANGHVASWNGADTPTTVSEHHGD